MATTVTRLMPVVLISGSGSDVVQPVAISSVGGMATSAVTMLIVPCAYCWVQKRRLKRRPQFGA